jgi:hypothetical protein
MLEDLLNQLNVTLPSPLEGQLKDTDIREALEEAHFPTATIAQETQRETRLRLEHRGNNPPRPP